MTSSLSCGRFRLPLDRPLVMGIVNVTPDSFYDGGRYADPGAALQHARCLIEEGADILDIGGESSRPGAAAVDAEEELRRVLPVLEGLLGVDVPVAVDTVARTDAAVCLMHMQGSPRTMQANPVYDDVVAEVRDFLAARAEACLAAGVARERIVVDPGFGFGKTVEHNLALLGHLDAIATLGYPVLAGWSRKSSLGRITGKPGEERLASSVAAALLAVQRGARIVRVHDVAATR